MDALARSTIKWVRSSGDNTWKTIESNSCISLRINQYSSDFIDILHFWIHQYCNKPNMHWLLLVLLTRPHHQIIKQVYRVWARHWLLLVLLNAHTRN
jgi:hypothetical protein